MEGNEEKKSNEKEGRCEGKLKKGWVRMKESKIKERNELSEGKEGRYERK